MAFLFRVFLLIALLSSAVSKPLPYTIERLEYGVNENDVRDIEQERASGVDEVSLLNLIALLPSVANHA